jgi:hypothetical protein
MFYLTRKNVIPVTNYVNSVTKTKYITLLNQKVIDPIHIQETQYMKKKNNSGPF